MADAILAELQRGCEQLELTLSEQQIRQLHDYVLLLAKWNKVYNLTSVRDVDEMVERHVLDSLTILPYLSGQRLLDVGSGGGLPGIPVAIARPDLAVTLLDSNSKKTRFLQQVKAELGLDNVTVVHARVEQADLPQFDLITARAFATIADIMTLTKAHCEQGGQWLLMKGVYPTSELEELAPEAYSHTVHDLAVTGQMGERHLVVLTER